MTTVAHPASARARARRERARRRLAGRRLLAGGIVRIVTVAVLLAGVVAVNVAVLRLNLDLDSANRQRAQLKADIAALDSQLASVKNTQAIVAKALAAGLVPADPSATSYPSLPSSR